MYCGCCNGLKCCARGLGLSAVLPQCKYTAADSAFVLQPPSSLIARKRASTIHQQVMRIGPNTVVTLEDLILTNLYLVVSAHLHVPPPCWWPGPLSTHSWL